MTGARSILLCLCLLFGSGAVLGQTLSSSDGEMNFPTVGLPSTLLAVPIQDTTMVPLRTGLESGTSPLFVLTSSPGKEYRISFALNTANDCGEIDASFENQALYWIEGDARLDPNAAQTIACDASGQASFRLGVTVTLPSGWTSSWGMLDVGCTAVEPAAGETLKAGASVGISYVLGVPLDLDGSLTKLAPGTTYTLQPEFGAEALSPLRSGRERGSPSRFVLRAIGREQVKIDWLLPTSLRSESGGRIPCSFSHDAGRLDETGDRFDPNVADTFTVGGCGTLTLDLGLTLTVPTDAAPGVYRASVTGNAVYIGNLSRPQILETTEGVLFFTVEVAAEEIPDGYALMQNYPNPFNASTMITYGLPRPQEASVSVYDLLGRNVAELASGHQSAGWHRVEWDAGAMPSGVYFIELRTPSTAMSRKLLLVR